MLKRFFNTPEKLTHDRLERVCTNRGARVFAKVRLADVFVLSSRPLSSGLVSFALKAHSDFLVVDSEGTPLFAVEFDGPSHDECQQQRRDRMKDELFEMFTLPLLRINSRYMEQTHRGLDLLTWIVETWFLAGEFDQEQSEGRIPPDEAFDPLFVHTHPNFQGRFPFWLSSAACVRLYELCQAGRIRDPGVTVTIRQDTQLRIHGYGYVMIDAASGVYARTGMRQQRFPFEVGSLIRELLTSEVSEKVSQVLAGTSRAVASGAITAGLNGFEQIGILLSRSVVRGHGASIDKL